MLETSQTTSKNLADWSPLLFIALGWGALGAVASAFLEADQGPFSLRFGSFLLFWALSLLNLFYLARAAQELVSPRKNPRKIALFGTLKFATLGGILWLLYQYNYSFKVGLVLGLGTLVILPLAGGLFWSRRTGI